MSERIPLGEREGPRLEFKEAAALADPRKISREVVGMLNAEGGVVWVGVREKDGRAIEIESIAEPQGEQRRLLDSLIDTVEPSPTGRELEIKIVTEEEKAVLRIEVAPNPSKKPYAFLREGGRHFVIRVGDRIRPMAREEILQDQPLIDDRTKAIHKVVAEQKEMQEKLQKNHEGLFWLRLQPSAGGALDLTKLKESDLLIDPTLSGNSRVGASFVRAYLSGKQTPALRPDDFGQALAVGVEGGFFLAVYRDGGLRFTAPLRSFLLNPHDAAARGSERLLWPYDLVSYPVSIFRLARSIFSDDTLWEANPPPGTTLITHMAFFNLRGWMLRAGSPRKDWWESQIPQEKTYEAEDFVLNPPLVFDLNQVVEPDQDRCALRLVRRVYEDGFGLFGYQIPEELDQKRVA